MRQRFSQSYHIFDSSLTRVKGTVKVISIFDLAFDKNQMCDKSNFSCRAMVLYPKVRIQFIGKTFFFSFVAKITFSGKDIACHKADRLNFS